MYAHVQLGVKDMVRMCDFYDRVLRHLGLVRAVEVATAGMAGVYWRRPHQRWPQFVINTPFDGQPSSAGHGSQVSFLADSRAIVDAAWAAALAHGGVDQGQPGLRPQYAEDFYAAYCLDPEGHKLCFVHTLRQTA